MKISGVSLARREFLKGGALVIGFSLTGLPLGLAQTAAQTAHTLNLDEVDTFLAVRRDGSVIVYSGKVDLGTGHRIAMRQIVAEELTIDPARIELIEGDTALTPNQGPTAGSTGVMRGGMQLRQAAASAREALLARAAAQLPASPAELSLSDGYVSSATARLSIAELVGDRAFGVKMNPKAPLKNPAQYDVVGKSLPRPDLPAKFAGSHIYVHDHTLPGMLHGRPLRPPAVGARLLEVDAASVAHLPGVQVVRIKDFLGVVAGDEWAAVRAARELKARWSAGSGLIGHENLGLWARRGPFVKEETIVSKGDTSDLANNPRQITASYQWPIQSHASLGPSCAVADVRADGATIWTASQATHRYQPAYAQMLGLPPGKVRLIYLDGSGCYGMNGHDDAAADAALLSKAVGAPVRVQWMREDELGWDPKGPPQLLELRAALDAQGHIDAWEAEMWVPLATANLAHVPLLAPYDAGIDQPVGQMVGLVTQNADPPYRAARVKVSAHWLEPAPLRPSNIRAPGKVANCFAVEAFIDELAAAAQVDPLEFRRRDLADPRGIEVLDRCAALIGWQPAAAARRRSGAVARGRGIAYVHYKHSETYVAMAMDVEVVKKSGEIRVKRVACAHDCGLMINPGAVRNQVEGNILQTLSRSLFEETTFDRQRVTSVDWASYRILRFPEAPELLIDLIQRIDQPPLGAGEAASAPVAAALANAVHDAIGVRLRSAPFSAERVLAALRETA
jgi:CO/xanthine dehydrogenase Mo-binding subunit